MSTEPKNEQPKTITKTLTEIRDALIGMAVIFAAGYGVWAWLDDDRSAAGKEIATTALESAPDPEAQKAAADAAAAVKSQQEAAEAAKRARTAEDEANKKAGLHCLSLWDGSHPEFTRLVEKDLRDPSTFEHIQTLVWPMTPTGRHKVLMRFRAANGFGGMTISKAVGTFGNEDCTDVALEFIE
jgi:hypothetical protein